MWVPLLVSLLLHKLLEKDKVKEEESQEGMDWFDP